MADAPTLLCKKCQQREGHWIHDYLRIGGHKFEPVATPASTAEPPVSQEVADHNKYGVMRPRSALREEIKNE